MQQFRLPFFLSILLLCCLTVAVLPAKASDTTPAAVQQADTGSGSPFNTQAELPVYPPDDPTTFAARTSKRIDCIVNDHPHHVVIFVSLLFVLLIVALLLCLGNKCSRICSMEAQLNKDELTGLPNMEKLKSLCSALLTTQVTADYMLLSGDICQFKTINDQLGHLVGDSVLQAVAQEGVTVADGLARLYRYGGEELAILIPGEDGAQALALLERWRQRVLQRQWRETGLVVTFSAGLGQWRHESAAHLIARVDRALYQAKEAGKNRVHPAG